jgi:prolipoprotein diacylglyceryltransferase
VALWLYANYDIRSKWILVIPTSFSVKKRKKEGQSYLWVLDRVAIVVAITGALIRTGNFMNSEMEGVKTGTDYGVVYARATEGVLNFDEDAIEEVVFEEGTYDPTHPGYLPMRAVVKLKSGVKVDQAMKGFINGQLAYRLNNYQEVVEHVDFAASGRGLNYQIIDEAGAERIEINATGILRHTPQLYEAIACLIIAFILLALWNYKRAILNDGLIFSVFMVLLWGDRFFNEFFKMNQEAFEASLPINMGQILSIPLILIGVVVFLMTVRKKETV